MTSTSNTTGPSRPPRPTCVVVVTYEATAVLGGLLDSLAASAGGDHVPVLVVDNGSRDGTASIVRARDGIALIEQLNTGYAHGVNRGIEAAPKGHDILVLNPDVLVAKDAIVRLSAVLEGYPDVGVVAPALFAPDGTISPSLRREPRAVATWIEALVGGDRAGRFGERFTPCGDELVDADWVTGAAMLLRRETVERLGGFSEAFFMYSEETEYCLRVKDAGERIVCAPLARMTHQGGQMGTDPRLWALRAVNRVRLQSHRRGRWAGFCMRLAGLAFETRRALTRKTVSRAAVMALLRPNLDTMAAELVRQLGGETRPMLVGTKQ